MKYDVFISYSRKDYLDESGKEIPGNVISILLETFKEHNISYWLDKRNIQPGISFSTEINNAIENSKLFLFVSSKNSNQSEWTESEITIADYFNKKIIPFRIDPSPYSSSINAHLLKLEYIDYTQDRKAALKRLVDTISGKRVTLSDAVSLDYTGADYRGDGIVLSKEVLAMFNSSTLSDAISSYLLIVEKLRVEENAGNNRLDEIVRQLEYVKSLEHYHNQKEEMRVCSRNISKYLPEVDRMPRLLLQLAQMLCFFYLGEMSALDMVKSAVDSSEYEQTFLEEYGAGLKQVGMIALSILSFIAMKGNVGAGLKVGSSSGSTLANKHKQKQKLIMLKYKKLKEIIGGLRF